MKKERIDKLLQARGLAESRTKAQALVMAGVVLVDEKRVEKPSESFAPEAAIRLKGDSPESRYVSRGGLKLEKALEEFGVDPTNFVCLDVGSSTGGFTDCLLKRGSPAMQRTILENPNARISENGFARIIMGLGSDTSLAQLVAGRPDLPAELRPWLNDILKS